MDFLTVQDAAKRLGVTVGRVHHFIKDGRLPAEKLGSQYVIKESDLQLVEKRQTGRPTAAEPSKAALAKRRQRMRQSTPTDDKQ